VATRSPLFDAPAPGGAAPAPASRPDRLLRLKKELHERLVAGIDRSAVGRMSEDELRAEVRRATEELCRTGPDLINLADRERLVGEVLDETFGHGPLEPLLRDPTVGDILVNGPTTVYVERAGRLERTAVAFNDERHLLQIVQRLVGWVGRRVDETSPMVDARLPDGSRVNAIIPPLALDGTLLSIRRFGSRPLRVADLTARGALPAEVARFLAACVRARVNVVISGGTGGGKTTLLNALSAFIPEGERIATIEDAAELRLQQPHVARMETRPPNVEGTGEVTMRELVRNALRMRPDRIVVGECRGGEALDMLQAMNTGHDGSMTTVHANDTRDALSRLEVMVGLAAPGLPMWIIRRQIAGAVHLLVHVARLVGGVRKVTRVSEVLGTEGDEIRTRDVFVFTQTGVGPGGAAEGAFSATGARPGCLPRLAAFGAGLPDELFEARVLPGEPAGVGEAP
jgi:pilus assembly protein CpaF